MGSPVQTMSKIDKSRRSGAAAKADDDHEFISI
jgi:hypothetical protein